MIYNILKELTHLVHPPLLIQKRSVLYVHCMDIVIWRQSYLIAAVMLLHLKIPHWESCKKHSNKLLVVWLTFNIIAT